MQLSRRMELLAEKVTPGNRLADVGTDHAYIPIALARAGVIPSAIAMDINEGPLKRARAHIREFGPDTYIETRLSDGLAALKAGEADTVLIAGMGGQLTRRILSEGGHCLPSVRELVLQPQSEIRLVREYLILHEYEIIEEDVVCEDGKYYPMMKAIHGNAGAYRPCEYRYGKKELQRSPGVLREYLAREQALLEKIRQTLKSAGQEHSERMREVSLQLEEIKTYEMQ